MKTTRPIIASVFAIAVFAAPFKPVAAGELGPVVDDFANPERNSLGFERHFLDDSSTGGQTRTDYRVEDGVLSASGELAPARGQPGWASTVLLLDPQGQPQDASAYEGVRLLVRVNKGTLSISANSSEITNFDYHAATVSRSPDGGFHEVRIPFDKMKRAWSEQTPLNTGTLTSLSLVAFGVQKGPFDFDVDEVSFY